MWKAPFGSADLSVQRQSGRVQTQAPGKGRLCLFSPGTSFNNLYLSPIRLSHSLTFSLSFWPSSIQAWQKCLALRVLIKGRLPGHSLWITCWRPARRKMWVDWTRISFDSVFLASGSALEVLHRSVFPMPNQLHLYCPPGKGNTVTPQIFCAFISQHSCWPLRFLLSHKMFKE